MFFGCPKCTTNAQFPDGALYEGEWMKVKGVRQRHGIGKYTDGAECYEGEWENGAMTKGAWKWL